MHLTRAKLIEYISDAHHVTMNASTDDSNASSTSVHKLPSHQFWSSPYHINNRKLCACLCTLMTSVSCTKLRDLNRCWKKIRNLPISREHYPTLGIRIPSPLSPSCAPQRKWGTLPLTGWRTCSQTANREDGAAGLPINMHGTECPSRRNSQRLFEVSACLRNSYM